MKYYGGRIEISSNYRFCSNCFRFDTYKNCKYGCIYCFANLMSRDTSKNYKENRARETETIYINVDYVERLFNSVFNEKCEIDTLQKELISKRVPIHLGAMCDPFPLLEKELGITKRFIGVTNKYNYPVIMSTKGVLTNEELKLFNNKLNAFQVSLFSSNKESIRKFETATYDPDERIDFISRLHKLGFWVSLRIQPLIYIDEAVELISKVRKYVNFVTIEHIKLARSNPQFVKTFCELSGFDKSYFVSAGAFFHVNYNTIRKEIIEVKKVLAGKVKLGVGDNAFMQTSDTSNCCGLDTINENFNNYISYNCLGIYKGTQNNGVVPQSCPQKTDFYKTEIKYIEKTKYTYKQQVDAFYKKWIKVREEIKPIRGSLLDF